MNHVGAHAYSSVPFALADLGRGELPARGWDEVLARAFADLRRGTPPDTVSAIEAVAPASMTVAASVEEWRDWTGLPFTAQGPVEVPGALSPVHCEPERGYAVYVEPNVWVRHRL